MLWSVWGTKFLPVSICIRFARSEVVRIGWGSFSADSKVLDSIGLRIFCTPTLLRISLIKGTCFKPLICREFPEFWLFDFFRQTTVPKVLFSNFRFSQAIFLRQSLSFPYQRKCPKQPSLHSFTSFGTWALWSFKAFWPSVRKLRIRTCSSIIIFLMTTFQDFTLDPWFLWDRFELILWNLGFLECTAAFLLPKFFIATVPHAISFGSLFIHFQISHWSFSFIFPDRFTTFWLLRISLSSSEFHPPILYFWLKEPQFIVLPCFLSYQYFVR